LIAVVAEKPSVYVERRGKALTAAARGIELIERVHEAVKSPQLTGEWELALKRLERGEGTLDDVSERNRRKGSCSRCGSIKVVTMDGLTLSQGPSGGGLRLCMHLAMMHALHSDARWRVMAMLTVRNLPEEVHRALRVRAAQHGRSTEAEVRVILEEAVKPEGRLKLGSYWASISKRIGLTDEEFEAMERLRDRTPAEPMKLEE
jgi:plasmid stability protein